jgi:hypothetical protein
LPENLPPSFHCDAHSRGGAISYSLEVVGDRPGIFRTNRRIRRVFSVVPAASQNQLLYKESLRQGWIGAWKDIKQAEQLRQGIWGEYSRAHVTVCPLFPTLRTEFNYLFQLSIPDLPSFPIATPIPYSFHVVTETKTLDRTDRPEDKNGKPLFPAPPTQSTNLKQVLRRRTTVRVRNRYRHIDDSFDLQGIRSFANAQPAKVEAVVDEPEWVPRDDKNRGFWRRTVHFNSTLAFPYAPTFSTEALDWLVMTHPFLAEHD